MGYTTFTSNLIKKYIKEVKSVLDFGSMNDYRISSSNPPFINDTFYKENGITDYTCIDLAGDNNALKLDVSYPVIIDRTFDLVIDAGFSEHVVQMNEYEIIPFHNGYINSVYPKGEIKSVENGYFNCWLNKHNLCKIGGIIISENPLTENWLQHGYSYLTENFYKELNEATNYEILELGINPASGNDVDGWNVHCVMKKHSDKFPSFEEFSTFDVRKK